MRYLAVIALPAALLAAPGPALAQSKTAAGGRPVLVRAVLDYSNGSERAADAFFKALGANSGKGISLVLQIIPRQDAKDPGYALSRDPAAAGEGENVLCGQGNYGLVDNYASTHRLTFQHPKHFHAPTHIIIGDRKTFPFHGIRCGVEDHTTKELTHLHVSGSFVVTAAEIPTAISYTLYPYAP
jgi:hypothetical protein